MAIVDVALIICCMLLREICLMERFQRLMYNGGETNEGKFPLIR